jgi:hypothetical protein
MDNKFEHTIGDVFSAIDSQKMFAELKGQPQNTAIKPQGQAGQGLQMPNDVGRPGGRQNG